MTNGAFLPSQMLKEASATSYTGRISFENSTLQSLDLLQWKHYTLSLQPHLLKRTVPLGSLGPKYTSWLPSLPWFLECNPATFPSWIGQPDPRNQALLFVLKQLASGKNLSSVDFLLSMSTAG